ncbi:class II aldolase/adducin family protein [Rhodoplanes roseus]|uniref:class II aldolase/adducin family protein n=1 Tax=Rhodoplanes roseus TaxID=29409 RepID=UPI001FDEFAA1|nr:class II aldolase/adducin family protein [Rhodoplanes roseus]
MTHPNIVQKSVRPEHRWRLGLVAAVATLLGVGGAAAQSPGPASPTASPTASTSPIAGVDAALVNDIVIGSRILAEFGVLDGFGHVSARHPTDPNRFLMARSLAPALVTSDDIMEFDLDGNPVDARGRAVFLERFIHGEVYRARPDVRSVVHTHSPGVIPFSVSKVPLQAMYHNPAFLAAGVPIFDIRDKFGATDMLVRNAAIGKALADSLGDKSVVLMRGHGDVTVGPSIKAAVFRAYYTDVNARLQSQAIALGGDPTYLTVEEGAKADATNLVVIDRIWNLWSMKIVGASR